MTQKIDLSQQQIQKAAQAGVQLLNAPGAVSVPGPMSITGITQVLHAVLLGIAEGTLVVLDLKSVPEQLKKPAEAGPADPPNKEVAAAVAAVVESSGNSSEAPAANNGEGSVAATPAIETLPDDDKSVVEQR